jgi:hypothetical protein
MHILIWLPDLIWHLMAFFGVIGLFASQLFGFIPFVGKYSEPIKGLSVVLLVFGFYMEGALAYQSYWDVEVKNAQINAGKTETKQAETTVNVITKYIDRVKIVKEKGDVVIREIPKYITKEVDANCTIPESVRMLHTDASRNEVSETSGIINDTSSQPIAGFGSK